ncbi:MAG: polysaccharide biosynthesis C-terminal domain-containing protein [Bacteroidota bacterium]
MGIIVRQGFKAMLANYVGMLFGMVNVLVLYPSFVSAEVFGLTRVFYEASMFYYIFAQIGINSIAFRYFPRFKDFDKGHHGFLTFTLIYPLIGFVLFTVLYFVLREPIVAIYIDKSPLVTEYFHLLPLMVVLMIFHFSLETYTRLHNRSAVTSYVREIGIRALNVVGIFLFALEVIDVAGFLIFLSLSYGVATLVLTVYLKRMGWLFLGWPKKLLQWAVLKEMVIYGGFTILGSIGSYAAVKLDIMMVPAMMGLPPVSYYFIAVTISRLLQMPRDALRHSVIPTMSDAIEANDQQKIDDLNKKSSINMVLISGLLIVLISVNLDAFYALGMLLWKDAGYLTGVTSVYVLMIARLIDNSTGMSNEMILYSKYYKYQVAFMFAMIGINYFLNLWLIPVYGLSGAAMATGLSVSFIAFLRVIAVKYMFRSQPYTWTFLWLLLLTALVTLPVYFIPLPDQTATEAIVSMLVKTLVGSGAFLGIAYWLKLSPQANALGEDLLRRGLRLLGR